MKGGDPVPVEDAQWRRQQSQFLYYKAMENVVQTKGNPLNYVLYKGKRYSVSKALCFVVYKRKLYAVIGTSPDAKNVPVEQLKKVGEVYRNKKGETDLTDTPEEHTEEAFPVYRLKFGKTLFVTLPEHKEVCYPMLLVRAGGK